MKKSRSQKRKPHATSEPQLTGIKALTKKKTASKKPKLGGEEKTTAKPHLEHPNDAIHLHARPNKTPKARAAPFKHAERKDP